MRAAALEISVLGELAVRRGAQSLALPASRKTRALLGYLVATAKPQPRSRLCDLFWEGPVDPRAELRWSLSKLRALLVERGAGRAERLAVEDDSLVFRSAGAAVDLEELRGLGAVEAADRARLERAAALFRGELLAGLELPDCFRFNAWLIGERERLFTLRGAIHQRLTALDLGGAEAALGWARSWLAIDPLSEAAHAAAVRALLELGRPREANLQVESCRRIFKQELHQAPGALLEAARAHRPRSAPAAQAAPAAERAAATALHAPPMTGRAVELERLETALAAGERGTPAPLLLVAGEPGIGKSRLLQELGARLALRGGRSIRARGFEAEAGRAGGVWIDLARAVGEVSATGTAAAELAALVARLAAPAGAGGGEPFDLERLRQSLGDLLARLSPGAPLLVTIDDLQWVDEASLALLHGLVTRAASEGDGAATVYAAALRPGEIGARSPAARLLRDLERQGRLLRVNLGRLPDEECEALARSVAPHADAAAISRASEGHPYFAVELARVAATEAVGDDPTLGLPPTLQTLVGERLARLEGEARSLVALAAVLGTGFEVETLAVLAGLPAASLLNALDELEAQAIFRASAAAGGYDFAHDIVRRVAYEQIAPPRRRFLHAGAARALAGLPDRDGSRSAAVARQAALGGLDRLAAESWLAAAGRSLRLAAVADAAEQCERGLGHLAAIAATAATATATADIELETLALRFALLRVLLHATQGLPRRAGVGAEVRRSVELARAAGRSGDLQVGLYLLAVLYYAEGDLSAAERHVLEQAEALRGAEPRVAAAALANAGRCLAQIERDHARAEALLLESRELATRAGVELVDIPWGLGMVAQAAGREAEASAELTRALELARAAHDPWIESQCLARLAAMSLEQGELDAAIARCRELAALAARSGEPSDIAIAAALEALARFESGDPAAAAGLDAALAALRVADSKHHLAFVLNRAAARDFAEGRHALAAARAGEALDAAARIGRKEQLAHAHLLRARLAAAGGDAANAGIELAAAAELNRPAGALGGRIWTEIEAFRNPRRIPTPMPTAARHRRGREKGAAS